MADAFSATLRFGEGHGEAAHVEHGDQIEISDAVEEHPPDVVIGAAEDDIARFEGIAQKGHFRAASMAWASARPARRDCAMM